jgi:hypothetical protein
MISSQESIASTEIEIRQATRDRGFPSLGGINYASSHGGSDILISRFLIPWAAPFNHGDATPTSRRE